MVHFDGRAYLKVNNIRAEDQEYFLLKCYTIQIKNILRGTTKFLKRNFVQFETVFTHKVTISY